MIIQDTVKGSEIEISGGSYIYLKDDTGKDIFVEWSELHQDTRSNPSKLVNEMEEILRKGREIIL